MLNKAMTEMIELLEDMGIEEELEPAEGEEEPRYLFIKTFKQVEPYEGQFDNISEYMLVPPTVFVELPEGNGNPKGRKGAMTNTISLFVSTNHIKGIQPTSMLSIISKLRRELHGKSLADGYLEVGGYRRLGNFPGFITYEITLTHTEA